MVIQLLHKWRSAPIFLSDDSKLNQLFWSVQAKILRNLAVDKQIITTLFTRILFDGLYDMVQTPAYFGDNKNFFLHALVIESVY